MKTNNIAHIDDHKQLAHELIRMKPKAAKSKLASILAKIKDPKEAEALLEVLCGVTEDFIEDCNAQIERAM